MYYQTASGRMSADIVITATIDVVARNYQLWSCFQTAVKTVVADKYQEEVNDAEKSVS